MRYFATFVALKKVTQTINFMENKTVYMAPAVEVLEFRQEGVICQSIPGYGDGGDVPFGD